MLTMPLHSALGITWRWLCNTCESDVDDQVMIDFMMLSLYLMLLGLCLMQLALSHLEE